MRSSRALTLLPLLMSACLLGEAWPERYAIEVCHTEFECVDGEDLSTNTDWEDEADCVEKTAALVRTDPKYLGFEEGACRWDGAKATECLDAMAALRSSDTCDGAMTHVELAAEGVSPACLVVYDCAE
jgi:hypothetical protein